MIVAIVLAAVLGILAIASIHKASRTLKEIRYEFEAPAQPYFTEGTLAELARHIESEK